MKITDFFSTLLTITLIVLKLCNIITWSWVWVFAPIWIGWSVVFILFLLALILSR